MHPTWRFKIRQLLPSHIELFKLIENPDFNRFEYYEKTLVPDFQFSDSLRNNATKWLFVRINWIEFGYFLDLDNILQFLNILRTKVEGMSFQYGVVLPIDAGIANSKAVQKLIVGHLNIPMNTHWFILTEWFYQFRAPRSLALIISRIRTRFLPLPDKEIVVKFQDHCEESTLDFSDSQHICNTDFLREDNIRAILQSIDSHLVKEERKIEGTPPTNLSVG